MSESVKLDSENEERAIKILSLDIPPRIQWNHGNGYCGETSLQCIGLYYGAWISQEIVHKINKGEYLLQKLSAHDWRDPIETLKIFHFDYETWDWENSPQPQFRDFCVWMKRCLLKKNPVFFGIYLPETEYDDYDHIVPAVGIEYKSENEYDPEDKLIYYDLYDCEKIEKYLSEEEFGATRSSIDLKDDADDGCIPLNIAYGICIKGITDQNKVTLPVHLSVSELKEPNPFFFHEPIKMNGVLTVRNLTIGEPYIILRYGSYENVPIKGNIDDFLQSKYESKHEFTADDTTYVYKDPSKILTKSSVYYRCIPAM